MNKKRILPILMIFILTGVYSAQATTAQIEPGQWSMPHQLWLDGKEVSQGLKNARAEILKKAQERMTADQRAEFDQKMEQENSDMTCFSPEEAQKINSQEMLQSLFESPWECRTDSIQENGLNSSTSNYHCTTPKGGRSEGKITWQAASSRQFRVELNGKGTAVENRTGIPVSKRLISMRSVTEGKWVASKCSISSGD
jgi:hypothetical protein